MKSKFTYIFFIFWIYFFQPVLAAGPGIEPGQVTLHKTYNLESGESLVAARYLFFINLKRDFWRRFENECQITFINMNNIKPEQRYYNLEDMDLLPSQKNTVTVWCGVSNIEPPSKFYSNTYLTQQDNTNLEVLIFQTTSHTEKGIRRFIAIVPMGEFEH